MHLFWIGFPGPCGGANTEAWHTAKMLRKHGVGITWIPTKGADLSFAPTLEAIGCKIIPGIDPKRDLGKVAGLRDSTIISMCNSVFTANASLYRGIGCRVVWVNCMTFMFSGEVAHYRRFGKTYDAYVFQSDWQRKQLEPKLQEYGHKTNCGHTIRGAFDVCDFPFDPRPHEKGERFIVGKLSRAATDKYSSNHWPIFNKMQHPKRAFAMGWSNEVQRKCGKPPQYATCLPSNAIPVTKFLRQCHALCQINGGAGENWPRVGLEAMAAGVPIVAQDRWGWQEMIDNGRTGLLCSDNTGTIAATLDRLAVDEPYRLEIAHNARDAVVNDLASDGCIWPKWESMLKGLQ